MMHDYGAHISITFSIFNICIYVYMYICTPCFTQMRLQIIHKRMKM